MPDGSVPQPNGAVYALRLSGGLGCRLTAADAAAADTAAQLAQIMGLGLAESQDAGCPSLWLTTDEEFCPPPGAEACLLPSLDVPDLLYCRLALASAGLTRILVHGGAVLLHAVLAVVPGQVVGRPAEDAGDNRIGVLLAAPGGTGKSTAARRLPPPWQGASDDAVLVVPEWSAGAADFQLAEPLKVLPNRWLAHPWPTWSRFYPGAPGGSWPVQEAVLLLKAYFLERADAEWVEPIGPGHAAVRLHESAKQINITMLRGCSAEKKPAVQWTLFNLATALARCLPAACLHLSLQGAFWQALEADLAPQSS